MLTQVSTCAWLQWALDSGKGAVSPTLRILVRMPRRTKWQFMGLMGPAESKLEVGNCTSAMLGGSGSSGILESASPKGPGVNSSEPALACMAPKTLAMAAHSVGVAFATFWEGEAL